MVCLQLLTVGFGFTKFSLVVMVQCCFLLDLAINGCDQYYITAMNNIPPRNSKELKLPPNNINININFTVKEPAGQQLNPAKPVLAGKKIDNFMHVSSNSRPEIRRTNVTTETLKDRRRQLLQEQDSTEVMLKTKRLDVAGPPEGRPAKRKQRSAKVSQTHQEVVQTAFSTSKAKSKNYSRELREMFARGGHEAANYLNNNPTPVKQQQSGDKTRRKSAERERNRRVFSNEKQRNPRNNKLTSSVENLRRFRAPAADNRTPSKSKSKSSGSKGSSTKRRNIAVPAGHYPMTERVRSAGSTKIRRSQMGLEFLNQLQESEIKEILRKSRKNSFKKLRSGSEAEGHKFTEEELAEIRAYMIDKKKKIDKQKQRKNEDERHRLERMRESLNKVEFQRKRGIVSGHGTIPQPSEKKKKKKTKSKSTIMSTKNQERQYDQLREEAMKLLDLPDSRRQFKQKENSKGKHAGSSSKKEKSNKKQPLKSLIDKYRLRQPQQFHHLQDENRQYINKCVVKIQSVVRGFLCRRRTLEHIKSIQNRVKQVQEQIKHKGHQFWDDNTNSIRQLNQDIDHSDSNIANPHEPSPNNLSQDNSWDEENLDAEQEEDEEEVEEGSSAQIYKIIEKLEKSKDPTNAGLLKKLRSIAEAMRNKEIQNIRIAREIQQLKKKQTAQKGRGSIDIEEVVSEEQQHPGTFDSSDRHQEDDTKFQIRIPVKISPPETKKPDPEPKPQSKPEPKKEAPLPPIAPSSPPQEEISPQQRQARLQQIDILKRFKQESDKMMNKVKKSDLVIDPNAPACEPKPKKPVLQQVGPAPIPPTHSLPSPKHVESNILELLRQKQKLLSDKHRLSAEEVNSLYRNKLVSPRSYNMRLNELEKIIEERNAIQKSMSEAERIIELVKSIEKDKQDVKRLQDRRGEVAQSKYQPETKPKEIEKPKEMEKDDDSDSHEESLGINNSSGVSGLSADDKEGNFMQPLPIPIQPRKIESIFNNFQQQQQQEEASKKRAIISIFEQSSLDNKAQQPNLKEVEQQVDSLNNEMIEFVEQSRENSQQNLSRSEVEPDRPSFDTNLNFVKEYCIGLCEFIRANRELKQAFKREIVTPIAYNPAFFLNSYRQTENGEYSNEYNSMRRDLMYPYFRGQNIEQVAITEACFGMFNDSFEKLQRHKPNASRASIELETYHLRCILGAFNEALNYERPNSVYGKPMPWTHNAKYLKNVNSKFDEVNNEEDEYTEEDSKFDHIFGVAIARIIQWGSSLCGFIPEALQLERGQVLHIDEEYINHIKQTRMALMLEKTLAEDQEKLLEFSDEETEVKLEVTNKIVEMLCAEFKKEWEQFLRKDDSNDGLVRSHYFEYIDD